MCATEPIRCALVALDAPSGVVASGAARKAFPNALVVAFPALPEALNGDPGAFPAEVLVLAEPDAATLAAAREATDSGGLPRWGIVVRGTFPPAEGVEVLAPEEWTEPLLVRTFRSTVVQHRSRRENARLTGDLRTIAHRISHDLRTPLGAILGTAEMMAEVLAERDPNGVALAASLTGSVDELERLIRRVSLLIKASVGRVDQGPVEMGPVVAGVLQRLERRILQRGIEVTQPESWPAVEGVASWLETMWSNLLLNALQPGVGASRIELGWSRQESELRFRVSDNGGGVAPDRCGALIQPFHLLHRPNAGAGLGLSIVQRLAELQGGNCGHEPRPGGGSHFYFTLPCLRSGPGNLQPVTLQP